MSIPDETPVEPLTADDVTLLVTRAVRGTRDPEEEVEEAEKEEEGDGEEVEAVQHNSHCAVDVSRSQELEHMNKYDFSKGTVTTEYHML